jgi:hypothetical protein
LRGWIAHTSFYNEKFDLMGLVKPRRHQQKPARQIADGDLDGTILGP